MKHEMTVVLLDDEQASLDVMLHYVQKHPQLELVATFMDPDQAAPWFRENEVDLLISDIDMPSLNGIDFIHSLVKKPLVILCTGHQDFALRGYEVDPIAFLTKPVRHDFFLRAIEKAAVQLQIETGENCCEVAVKKPKATYVTEVGSGNLVRVDFDDIRYIEAKDKLVTIHCLHHSVVTRTSLLALLGVLPHPDFKQVHRSFIVATDLIWRLKEGSLVLRDVKVEIPLGNKHVHRIRKLINDRQFPYVNAFDMNL